MSLYSPWLWAGLALPPLVALALWLWVRRRRRVAAALGDTALLRRIGGEDLQAVPWRRAVPVLLASLGLAAALADPRWGDAAARPEARGGRVVLVLDASSSMLATDAPPTRLAQERAAARALVRALPGTAFGVVVFAGRAYALAPPTPDRGAVELYLDALDPQMVTQTGSSLAGALRQGIGLLAAGQGEPGAGALVLVTDGDALDAPAQLEETVELARRLGVPVHAIGVGTEAGARVPDVDFATGQVRGYKREPTGEVAISRLGAGVLREIAAATHGQYVAASDPRAVERVTAALRGGAAGTGAPGTEAPARYTWFAAAALVLLALEMLAGRPGAGTAARATPADPTAARRQ